MTFILKDAVVLQEGDVLVKQSFLVLGARADQEADLRGNALARGVTEPEGFELERALEGEQLEGEDLVRSVSNHFLYGLELEPRCLPPMWRVIRESSRLRFLPVSKGENVNSDAPCNTFLRTFFVPRAPKKCVNG